MLFLNQFSEGSFLCPIWDKNCHVPDEILCCLNIAIQEFPRKKSGFLNKVLRPRSLRSLALAWACWEKLCTLQSASNLVHLQKIQYKSSDIYKKWLSTNLFSTFTKFSFDAVATKFRIHFQTVQSCFVIRQHC